MSNIIINPGTFNCENATVENAIKNIEQFIKDCNLKDLNYKRCPDRDYNDIDNDGRYCFIISKKDNDIEHEIQMPGWPLKQVRYIDNSQNIWNFPRLYVDGSSWVWKFALLSEKDFEKQEDE